MYRQLISPQDVEKFRQAVYATIPEVDRAKLGYIGLLGSANSRGRFVHDLDVLVFPTPEAGIGEAVLAMNKFLQTVDARLQKDGGLYLATCPRKILQPEVQHIISQVRGAANKLSTHTIFFPDYRSLTRISPQDFMRTISENSEAVLGNFDVIRQRQDKPQKTLEPYFFMTDYQIALVADRYPEQLTLEKTEDILAYLTKNYGLRAQTVMPRTPADCAKVMDEVLLELDRVA